MQNHIDTLSLFLDIAILKIDSQGNILEMVLNTKKGFKIEKFKTIYSLFSSKEKVRLQRLLESGIQIRKKHLELHKSTGIKDYVNVEISSNAKIYFFIQFVSSHYKRIAMYDRYVEQLASSSGKDPMTKVLNRQGLNEQLRNLIKHSDAKKRIGLIYMDMDNLKYVNDTYGHLEGDKVILNITKTLMTTVRDRDLVARLGGDEFLVVVEEVTGDKSTTYGLAKRLVKLVEKGKNNRGATVSVGVHVFEVGKLSKYVKNFDIFNKECEKEISLADEATYKAKKGGKNRVAASKDSANFYKLTS